jgi:hypothetical protein
MNYNSLHELKKFHLYVSMIPTLKNLATILYVYRVCSFCESKINLYNHCLQTLHSHLLICNLIYNCGHDTHLHVWRKQKPDRSDNLNPQLHHHENLSFVGQTETEENMLATGLYEGEV